MIRIAFLGALLASMLLCAGARAQHDVRWVAVSSAASSDRALAAEVAQSLAAAMRDARAPALSPSDAARLFEERSSRAARQVTQDQIATLSTSVQNLELYVATSRREAALREAQRIQALTSGTIDSLVQQREVATRLFAACLAVARLYLQSGDRDAARTEMFRCRQLGPDIELDRHSQPPNVFALLDEIDGDLRARPTRTLRIDTTAVGCDVLLNGRRVAVTPNPIRGVPMGEHRVELVCEDGRHSRFHRILLGSDDRALPIDLDFDDALSTDGSLVVTAPDAATEARTRLRFASIIARVLDASDVLIVTPEDEHVARIDRFQPDTGRVLASVRVSSGLPVTTYVEALSALRGAASLDFSNGQRAPMTAWQPGADVMQELRSAQTAREQAARDVAARERRERAQDAGRDEQAAQAADGEPDARADQGEATPRDRGEIELNDGEALSTLAPAGSKWPGWLFGAIGVSALGGAIGTTIYRGIVQGWIDNQIGGDPGVLNGYKRERDKLTLWPFALGAGGAIFTTVGLGYLLPDHDGIPWWSWLVGGLGVATAATGGALLAVMDCDPTATQCPSPSIALGHATAAWSASIPMLSVPIIYAVRAALHNDSVVVDANVSAERFELRLQGSF